MRIKAAKVAVFVAALIPFGLLWVMVTGTVVVLPDRFGDRAIFLIAAGVLGVLTLGSVFAPLFTKKAIQEVRT